MTGSNRSVPTPPPRTAPGRIPPAPSEPRHHIAADQYIRLQAARISADFHASRGSVKDSEILALAADLERFISTGKTGD